MEPINFWLLVQGSGDSSPHVLQACRHLLECQGDEAALYAELATVADAPVAVELKPSADNQRSFILPGQVPVTVQELSFGEGGLGAAVWDGGIALSIWLLHNTQRVAGRRVLEIGSGVGLSGIAASLAGAVVMLSDTPRARVENLADGVMAVSLLQNLQSNARLNPAAASVQTLALDWAECEDESFSSEGFDVVIGSDVIYSHKSVPALIAAVCKLTAPGGACHLLNVKSRASSNGLVEELRGAGECEVEDLALVNNFGRIELLLVHFRRHARQTAQADTDRT